MSRAIHEGSVRRQSGFSVQPPSVPSSINAGSELYFGRALIWIKACDLGASDHPQASKHAACGAAEEDRVAGLRLALAGKQTMKALQTVALPQTILRCQDCVIRHRAVCGAMDKEQIARLSGLAHRRKVPAGQIIMSDEAPATFFANIVSGTVKLTKTIADGRQQIVGLLFPPDFLGRAFSRNNPYFAEAASDVEICVFPNEAFERLVGEYPELQQRLFERTLDELDAAREWMLLLGRKTAEEKVASFLLMLARRSEMIGCGHLPAKQTASFELPLTRADIADYLGLTIETVSRQLTRLKTMGVITISASRIIGVSDMPGLLRAAGHEMTRDY
jgi:CRP/FNR family transcriptional regulator